MRSHDKQLPLYRSSKRKRGGEEEVEGVWVCWRRRELFLKGEAEEEWRREEEEEEGSERAGRSQFPLPPLNL